MNNHQVLTSITKNLQKNNVKLIAVSKTKPVDAILELYQSGQKIFGENKAQELKNKYDFLPKDIEWHFIGHLQSNKIKFIAHFISLIHSVDSLKLLQEINKHALRCERVIDCLLQFHIAEEETKFGLSMDEAETLLKSPEFKTLKNIRICGVMGMASFTDDTVQVRKEFKSLKEIFDYIKERFFNSQEYFNEISMGMSGDYILAIEEGATMVRIGSLLFGKRD